MELRGAGTGREVDSVLAEIMDYNLLNVQDPGADEADPIETGVVSIL